VKLNSYLNKLEECIQTFLKNLKKIVIRTSITNNK